MNNAFVQMGRTCVFTLIAGGLMAGALVAGSLNEVKLTVPHEVTVGSTTLPSGEYTISALDMPDGAEVFVVRSEHGPTVTLAAQRIEANEQTDKTEVLFKTDGDKWRFDKLFVQGDDTGYMFLSGK